MKIYLKTFFIHQDEKKERDDNGKNCFGYYAKGFSTQVVVRQSKKRGRFFLQFLWVKLRFMTIHSRVISELALHLKRGGERKNFIDEEFEKF